MSLSEGALGGGGGGEVSQPNIQLLHKELTLLLVCIYQRGPGLIKSGSGSPLLNNSGSNPKSRSYSSKPHKRVGFIGE